MLFQKWRDWKWKNKLLTAPKYKIKLVERTPEFIPEPLVLEMKSHKAQKTHKTQKYLGGIRLEN